MAIEDKMIEIIEEEARRSLYESTGIYEEGIDLVGISRGIARRSMGRIARAIDIGRDRIRQLARNLVAERLKNQWLGSDSTIFAVVDLVVDEIAGRESVDAGIRPGILAEDPEPDPIRACQAINAAEGSIDRDRLKELTILHRPIFEWTGIASDVLRAIVDYVVDEIEHGYEVRPVRPVDASAGKAAPSPLEVENDRLWREVNRLNLLINSPQTESFVEAVRVEAAHQVERWGQEHDGGKRSEDWVTLVVYLLGKAARAHFNGDRGKLLHHVITLAAIAMNWHRNLTGECTKMRPGVATDGTGGGV